MEQSEGIWKFYQAYSVCQVHDIENTNTFTRKHLGVIGSLPPNDPTDVTSSVQNHIKIEKRF